MGHANGTKVGKGGMIYRCVRKRLPQQHCFTLGKNFGRRTWRQKTEAAKTLYFEAVYPIPQYGESKLERSPQSRGRLEYDTTSINTENDLGSLDETQMHNTPKHALQLTNHDDGLEITVEIAQIRLAVPSLRHLANA